MTTDQVKDTLVTAGFTVSTNQYDGGTRWRIATTDNRLIVIVHVDWGDDTLTTIFRRMRLALERTVVVHQ